ncbi:MAG TPA: protein kinase [Polyangiaceae bacterium]|nr:protein kinase [Polyangiaceae bacterium]
MGSATLKAEREPRARLIAGKYRLIRPLGHGGMGAVWQAEHLTLHSPVAIKLLDPTIGASTLALQRFLHEARAAAALRSPHVVQILDHGVDEGTPYIVMEQLDGESLADRLAQIPRLSPLETAHIVTHIARALGRAHAAGIIHRDLKPENVFLVRNDDEEVAKLLDFGIAKSIHELGTDTPLCDTVPGMIVGTPYYMSPEQAAAAPDLDHRSDIWALGVIAFECLLGRRPFEGHTLHELLVLIREAAQPIPSELGPVPADFDRWFARACARDPSQRFESAKEAAEQLRQTCERAEATKRASSDFQATLVSGGATSMRPAPNTLRRRAPAALLLLLGAGLLALGVGFARMSTPTTPREAPATAARPTPASPATPAGASAPTLAPTTENAHPVIVSIVEAATPSPSAARGARTTANASRPAPRAVSPPHALTKGATPPSSAPLATPPRSTRSSVDLGI